MSHTDDLISRRQRADVHGERREFSVDRGHAIRKMRQFALADPSYYLLELIQAVIANGGGFLNIDLFRLYRDQDDLKMWWSGRGFTRFELLRLFDFLLISEDEPGCADTILLARGVNAMLHFKPAKVVIASGDGTLDGSTQVVITGDGQIEEKEVAQAVSGVRIHGERLNLSLLTPQPDQQLGDREVEMLRDKVIAPGVQVMLNGHFISDWNSAHLEQRHWGTESIEIDEDDLYGRLWVSPFGGSGEFDMMTWGVKIERLERDDPPFERLYGAVNFNRLNKTADHAKIVRDEVLDELWARLRPYADHLQAGETAYGEVTYPIERLGGREYRPPELVELLRTHNRALIVSAFGPLSARAKQAAHDIGDALACPVLVVPEAERRTLEMLAGTSVEFIEPRLDCERDVDMLTQPTASPPPRPWLVEPMKVGPIPAAEFVQHICDEQGLDEDGREKIASVLGVRGDVHMRVYSPERAAPSDDSAHFEEQWVAVLVCEREVYRAHFPTAFPGHELVIELPPASPSMLDETVLSGATEQREPIVALAAATCAQLAQHRLEQAHKRAQAALRRVSGADSVEEASKRRYIDEEGIEEHKVRGVLGLPIEPVTDLTIEVLEAGSGRIHRLCEPAGELGLVGELVAYDDSVVESKAWLEEVILRHGERLLDRLATRLPRIEAASEREQVAITLLEFAGRHLAFYEEAHATIGWKIEHPLARRILEIPLFPGRRRVPISALHIVRHLCAQRNAGRGEAPVDELVAKDRPAHLQRFIETYLDLSGVEPSESDGAKVSRVSVGDQPPERLLVVVEGLLERFRPDQADLDSADRRPVRDLRLSWASQEMADQVRVRLQSDHIQVHVDPGHALAERARGQATPESMAWLLLALYAEINARLEPVTNDHELAFQRRVADALEAGELVANIEPVATDQR